MIELKLQDLKRSKKGLFRPDAPVLLSETAGKITGVSYASLEDCLLLRRADLDRLGLMITVQFGNETKYTGFRIQREEDIVYLLNLAGVTNLNSLRGTGLTLHHDVSQLYGISFEQKQSGL